MRMPRTSTVAPGASPRTVPWKRIRKGTPSTIGATSALAADARLTHRIRQAAIARGQGANNRSLSLGKPFKMPSNDIIEYLSPLFGGDRKPPPVERFPLWRVEATEVRTARSLEPATSSSRIPPWRLRLDDEFD